MRAFARFRNPARMAGSGRAASRPRTGARTSPSRELRGRCAWGCRRAHGGFRRVAAEVEVATVPEELGAMLLILDLEGVSAKEVEELCEYVAGAVGNAWGDDGGWAQQTVTV
ncbi:hypothetical protein IFM46972_04884 [Aspergillus udagawae]|uniref:Uncharacterized protein n=1 Tax=Aspergillus udagawae TaxID=91492 RepID=A0A8H3NLP5_9EURO|nr:hypothetical protein IFM46972_04884 [Aspergillus udagawae]